MTAACVRRWVACCASQATRRSPTNRRKRSWTTAGAAAATCLILDVQLPGISGFELRERLARDGRAVPVIFVTAYDEPETRQHAAGAVACLAKPFAGRDLIDAVMQAHGESPPPRGRRWRDGR